MVNSAYGVLEEMYSKSQHCWRAKTADPHWQKNTSHREGEGTWNFEPCLWQVSIWETLQRQPKCFCTEIHRVRNPTIHTHCVRGGSFCGLQWILRWSIGQHAGTVLCGRHFVNTTHEVASSQAACTKPHIPISERVEQRRPSLNLTSDLRNKMHLCWNGWTRRLSNGGLLCVGDFLFVVPKLSGSAACVQTNLFVWCWAHQAVRLQSELRSSPM